LVNTAPANWQPALRCWSRPWELASIAPIRAPAATAWASWAWSRSAKAVVWLAVWLWPGQRFTRVPNRAAGSPQAPARCSIRKAVVVLPLVPVTPNQGELLAGLLPEGGRQPAGPGRHGLVHHHHRIVRAWWLGGGGRRADHRRRRTGGEGLGQNVPPSTAPARQADKQAALPDPARITAHIAHLGVRQPRGHGHPGLTQ
jgi:hypothetical protein